MLRTLTLVCGLGIGLVAVPAFAKSNQQNQSNQKSEQSITMNQLPEPVKSSLKKQAQGGKIEEIKKETKPSGAIHYKAEVVAGDEGVDFLFDQNGRVLERHSHTESAEPEHQH